MHAYSWSTLSGEYCWPDESLSLMKHLRGQRTRLLFLIILKWSQDSWHETYDPTETSNCVCCVVFNVMFWSCILYKNISVPTVRCITTRCQLVDLLSIIYPHSGRTEVVTSSPATPPSPAGSKHSAHDQSCILNECIAHVNEWGIGILLFRCHVNN